MEGPVYREKLVARGIAHEIPEADDRERINAIILNELVYGRFEETSRRYFCGVIETLGARGCDAVLLGCTEIPLLVTEGESPLPAIDSTRTLACAALREATRETEGSAIDRGHKRIVKPLPNKSIQPRVTPVGDSGVRHANDRNFHNSNGCCWSHDCLLFLCLLNEPILCIRIDLSRIEHKSRSKNKKSFKQPAVIILDPGYIRRRNFKWFIWVFVSTHVAVLAFILFLKSVG